MAAVDLIITFDTEDVFHPPEAGRDGVVKELADILTREGVPANFLLIASRAALLKERGRHDVIAALRQHSVGVHTLSHRQPVAAVRAAALDWEEGLEVCRQMEGEAFRIVAEALDVQPVCLSSHHLFEAPQNYVVARELGVPYAYGYPLAPPLFSVSRYCGTLNLPCESPYVCPGESYLPYFNGFDDALSYEPAFGGQLERFARHIDACVAARMPLLLIHPCHPVKTYSLDWIDNYITPNGVNIPPEEWPRRVRPGIRTDGQMELVFHNFRRLVRFIRRHPQLNVISIPEAAAKYGRVPAEISRPALLAAAQRICAHHEVLIEERYSPAEIVMALAEALTAFAEEGQLPQALPRRDVLGPLEAPLIIPEDRRRLGWESLVGLAAALQQAAHATGHLPANVPLADGARIGLGSVYRVLAEAYRAVAEGGTPPESVEPLLFDRQPRIGPVIGKRYLDIVESPLVVPNLSAERLYHMSKLQSWTLAPAWYA